MGANHKIAKDYPEGATTWRMNTYEYTNNEFLRMSRKLSILIFAMLLWKGIFAQQDPQYSQYMFNQLVINPAYCGSREALSAVADLRKQWVSMPGSPRTGTISLHGPLPVKSIGLGGHLISENIGPSTWSAVYGDIAYRIKLKRGKLSLGISAGMVNYNMNLSADDYHDKGEALAGQSLGSRTKLDASTGFYYYSNSFYIGGSITHLNNPNLYDNVAYYTPAGNNAQSTARLNFSLTPHSFLYLGKSFMINQNFVFNPSIMVKKDKSAHQGTADINFNFLLRQKLWLGVSLRSGYGVVGLFQYMVNDKLRIGYSYDQGINRIGVVGQGSHEIIIGYDFNVYKSKMLSPRFL
jgi:type IX secretion system PorP/SprF family membrane protein